MDAELLKKLEWESQDVEKEVYENLTEEQLNLLSDRILERIEYAFRKKAYHSNAYKNFEEIKYNRAKEKFKKSLMEAFNKKVPDQYKNSNLESFKQSYPKAYEYGMRILNTKPRNIPSAIICGLAGRGKTHFMWALAIALTEKNYEENLIKFTKAKTLDDVILASSADFNSSLDTINEIKGSTILMIDDFGMERSTERTERDWFDILDARYEWKMPVIISTNFTHTKIQETYGQRIFSRFKDYEWIKFDGEDLRGKNL